MFFFKELLNSENNIIKWNAIDIIANLTTVDAKNKFNEIFKKFYSLLDEGNLITAAHVVDGSGKIAKAKPKLQSRITKELLRVENVPLPTEECRNILKGRVITAFAQYFDQAKNREAIIIFVKKQKNNIRNATKRRAENFLNKERRA